SRDPRPDTRPAVPRDGANPRESRWAWPEPSDDNLRPESADAMPIQPKVSECNETTEQISTPVAGAGAGTWLWPRRRQPRWLAEDASRDGATKFARPLDLGACGPGAGGTRRRPGPAKGSARRLGPQEGLRPDRRHAGNGRAG